MSNISKWTEENIPDQSGKTIIITGANSGIGLESSRALAQKGGIVIMACRNLEKGQKALKEISTGNRNLKMELRELDLSSLASIRKFSEDFRQKYKKLDILINNAGLMHIPFQKTEDGFEMQLGVNHFGHFALTGLLMDMIISSKNSRVVNVASIAHKTGKIDFDNLDGERYSRIAAYAQSKLANLHFTYELQRHFEKNLIDTIAVAAHPGWSATNLQNNNKIAKFLNRFLAQPAKMGALPSLYASVDPAVKGADYIGTDGFAELKGYPVKVKSIASSYDQDISRKLWRISEEKTGVIYQF